MWNIFLKGIATVLPVGLTLYFVYWLSVSIERIFKPLLTAAAVPDNFYIPGMGLITGFLLLFFVGLAVNAWVIKRLFQFGENLLERIPLVKTVYGAIRDFTDYFSTTKGHDEAQKVVLIKIGEARLLGFITSENPVSFTSSDSLSDTVAVYMPMSYQIGGYTVYIPRSQLEPVDMPFEDAMRHVLTAGLSKGGRGRAV